MPRVPLLATLVAALAAIIVLPRVGDTDPVHPGVVDLALYIEGPTDLRTAARDSALDELRVGRAWHASRILRAEGAHEGTPDDRLLLARAESGWKHWDGVVELLSGASWLDSVGDGVGWLLLATAHEAQGRDQAAADAFARYLASKAGDQDPLASAYMARRILAMWRAGGEEDALALLPSMSSDADVVRSWTALRLAERAAAEPDTAALRSLLTHVVDEAARDRAWRLTADARLAAGDTVGALSALRAVREGATGSRRALAGVEVGTLLRARGDTAGAVAMMRASLSDAPREAAGRAARILLFHADPDAETSLVLGRALNAANDGGPALRAFDRAARLMGGAEALPEEDRLTRARLMSTVSARRDDAIEEFRAISEATSDPRIGARTLSIWAGVRRRQGLGGHVKTIQGWLVERYPDSPEATEILWDRAWEAESSGSTTRALELYEELARVGGSQARAGQARMRAGQLHLARGDLARTASIYESYLERYPDGRRWEEAAYWAAHARNAMGDSVAARLHADRLLEEEPFSYYAVMAADLVGRPFSVESVPPGDEPVEIGWLTEGLRRIDLLQAAGLERGAEEEEERLVERARGSAQVMLSLAEGLNARGRTIAGINLGWDLRRGDHPWTRRLLRVVYPFPYQEMIVREAREWGVDPHVVAALIRQESAFKADIVSHAGAIGLMQVMPPTGAELARRHGPSGFSSQTLTTAEVNLHLGTAYLLDMSRRFGELPLVLSAYNAGPTRANRWKDFPETGEWLRFTERVPFAETRGYIKNVSRNLGVYRALYPEVATAVSE